MLKFGITTLEQLLKKKAENTRLIAASLLLELSSTDMDAETAHRLRKVIVRSVALPNTTGKTTWKNRFPEIDEVTASILKRNFPRVLSCLDVGVSDGTTSIDLFSRLKSIPDLSYVASDVNECLYMRQGKLWTDVCTDNGCLIQVSIGPFVIPITTLSHMHPLQIINRCIYLWNCFVRRKKVQTIWKQHMVREGTQGMFVRMALLSTAFEDLANTDLRICFKRIDIFSPPEETYDFIRIMNVLNTRGDGFGFSDQDIVLACENIFGLLQTDSFFLVGRTVRSDRGFATNATLFQITDDQLTKCRVFGKGTEIESLILKAWVNNRTRANDKISDCAETR